jgi:hypothetical protein
MSNYTKATNFATKDTLPTGDANKIVKGTEIDNEFNSISGAISSKADLASPTFTGSPAAPTATAGSNTTQVANTTFVTGAITALSLGNMSTQAKSAVDITGGTIVGITDLAVADGGTGRSTLTANAVLVGNGTSGINTVAPGTSGNVLTSNGTAWVSGAGFLKAITRVSVLSSSSSGALSSTVSTTTFGGITPAFVMYFVSAYYTGTVNDLRSYLVCSGSSFDSDNILLGHGDDTDQNPTGAFADSTMVLLPYTESQQFHVTLTGSTGAPTLKVWAVGYQT